MIINNLKKITFFSYHNKYNSLCYLPQINQNVQRTFFFFFFSQPTFPLLTLIDVIKLNSDLTTVSKLELKFQFSIPYLSFNLKFIILLFFFTLDVYKLRRVRSFFYNRMG